MIKRKLLLKRDTVRILHDLSGVLGGQRNTNSGNPPCLSTFNDCPESRDSCTVHAGCQSASCNSTGSI